jgi:hypothetical protein
VTVGRRPLAICLLAGLAACAQAPSQRLTASVDPVDSVRVYAFDRGEGAGFVNAGSAAFIETLQRNGLVIADFVALDRAMTGLTALEKAWDSPPRLARASHALVLTRQGFDTVGAAQYVRYEAVLWEAGTRRLVWKSTLASLSNGADAGGPRRAEKLAGDVLRGLARDGFIAIPVSGPRDASGREIPFTVLPRSVR